MLSLFKVTAAVIACCNSGDVLKCTHAVCLPAAAFAAIYQVHAIPRFFIGCSYIVQWTAFYYWQFFDGTGRGATGYSDLYNSRYTQRYSRRDSSPCSCYSILHIACRRNDDLPGNSSKHTCCFVISVVGRSCPCCSVIRHADVAQDRIKSVGHGCVVSCYNSFVTGVGDREGVGECAVFGYCFRRKLLCDGEIGRVGGCNSFFDCDGGCDACTCYDSSVGDR